MKAEVVYFKYDKISLIKLDKLDLVKKNSYILHLLSSYAQMSISIVIPLLLMPYMLLKLGSEIYGLWILLGSVIAYFSLSNFGFNTTLLKELSQSGEEEYCNRYINTTLVFFLCISLLVFFIFLLFVLNIDNLFLIDIKIKNIAQTTFTVLYFVFLVNFIFGIFGTLLFSKGLLHIKNYISIIQSIFISFFTFFVLFKGYSIVAISLVNLLFSMIFSLVVLYYAKKHINFEISTSHFDIRILKDMIRPSFHYFLISISVIVVFYTDNIIISSFVGLSSVAIYSLGYKLVDVSQRILFKLVDVIVPDIALLYGEKKYRNILELHNKVMFYTLLLALFGYAILFFFGIDILNIWIGEKYSLDETIFRVFIFFAFSHTWVHVSGMFIAAMGIHKKISYMSLVEAFLNIVLSLILLKYYGLLGVALGTFFSGLLTSSWFVPYWFYKHIYQKINEEYVNG